MRGPIITFKRAKRLRREMSLPEVVLWQHLRRDKLKGYRFRRQHPIGPFILDFYCSQARLCIEIDGAVHDSAEQAAHDERRTKWLQEQGIHVLRFIAADVLIDSSLEGVLTTIELAVAPSTAVPAVPLPRFAGEDQK
ncbi:MAG TPA: endonuclease domain-containing protein [Devosia sp.]|jgi:very-short-patch-repair endonuclease|uniref:endonuclease domain-containing protein n=1 Tax=Devosia sp. TaxID=1871048 RepID=UPI002DDCFAE9|nr:endonuclease domain-containing protein [Devosia sp.]HEV2518151.1 endonuclease domain-containing protein [Devosia sp.]